MESRSRSAAGDRSNHTISSIGDKLETPVIKAEKILIHSKEIDVGRGAQSAGDESF